MRRGLAFGRETGRQNHFLHHALGRAGQQIAQADIARPHAIERRQSPHEHVIPALVGAGALHRRQIGRRFHHAQACRVAPFVLADGAQAPHGERMALRTMLYRLHGLVQRARDLGRAFAVALQQMEGHALGRLHAHPRQAAQGLDQIVERVCIRGGHGASLTGKA
ncbi:hypothetical protein D3C78_1398000 [compost metagenome]